MEKHRCKICCRRFANGRALGGHMRSHMANLPVPPKPELPPTVEIESLAEPSSSSSFSSDFEKDIEEEEENDDDEGVLKMMRENPKKSIKLADLEDRESETESTRNPTRQRSKRRRKPQPRVVVTPFAKDLGGDASEEAEPVSSISEVTSEEDVAFCLMMLSRDKWTCHKRSYSDIIIDDHDVTGSHKRIKKYRCETCNKVFRSYQALGGHRASHKKTREAAIHTLCKNHNNYTNNNSSNNNNNTVENRERKSHECPVCFKVFGSGQALGGHKRSHGMVGIENHNHQPSDAVVVAAVVDDDDKNPKKLKRENIFIDLNLPAPVDDDLDDEISQIALSAVSDAHF